MAASHILDQHPRMLKLKEVATRFRVSEKTARRWCRDRGLGRKVGGIWFAREDDLFNLKGGGA